MSNTYNGEYSPADAIAIADATGEVPSKTWLKYFRTFPSRDDAELQSEFREFLMAKYPKPHKEAVASAGNMHNPKIVALRPAFQEALMASSLV